MALSKNKKLRVFFAACSLFLLILEVLIALYVHDSFIRPYFGDVLVVILLYCLVRTVYPPGWRWLIPALFVFAVLVELSQLIPLVSLLRLDHIRFFVIVMGTGFSWGDIVCYAAGCLFVAGMEVLERMAGDEVFRER